MLERDWINLSIGEKRITIDQLLVKLQSFKVGEDAKISLKYDRILKLRIDVETSYWKIEDAKERKKLQSYLDKTFEITKNKKIDQVPFLNFENTSTKQKPTGLFEVFYAAAWNLKQTQHLSTGKRRVYGAPERHLSLPNRGWVGAFLPAFHLCQTVSRQTKQCGNTLHRPFGHP